ncbi:growth hormone-regulated TBC protein 1-A-like [Rhopilema esculentum]|uniref:growth hormone-regulated TBC protein 1-A-like n=1 Tax=Rhopilema esculentum TaxID=499914 RepID=UPI0031E35685
MAGITGEIDQYGFERPDDFDYDSYEAFMSAYLRVLARRAAKWEKLLGTKLSNLTHSRKVKRYVRKGVPSESRGEVWLIISRAKAKLDAAPLKYEELVQGNMDEKIVDIIERDIRRTYPENVYFRDVKDSQLTSLKNVLVAVAHYKESIGYCQGLNYIVGMLLLITKDEKMSFWLIVEILERLVPDFYSKNLVGVRVETLVLMELISQRHPDLYLHFKSNGIDLNLTTSKWFICLFMDVLPVETTLRIWDCLFYEGSKILLRVALTLIISNKEKFLASKDFTEICQTFKKITNNSLTLDCHSFLQNCFKVPGSLPMAKIQELRIRHQEELAIEEQKLRSSK